MKNLVKAGSIFYGTAIVVMGVLTIYYNNFPYMLLPAGHPRSPWFIVVGGIVLILAGMCFVLGQKVRQAGLLFGGLLLAIFCFYYIPYGLFFSHNYASLGEWENSEKELAIAGGALAIAGCFPVSNQQVFGRLGTVLFAITIVCFGILHFVFGKEASGLVPSWIPWHLFWIYFAGVALLGSGIAIILKIKIRLAATLLGTMILIWFIILHTPRVITSPATDMADEMASAFLALAYGGTAWVIAGGQGT
jgi:uncharacterized membrane protein